MKPIKQFITEFVNKDNIKVTSETKKGAVKDINDIEVGDVLYTVYQYSSRHVYFYQVQKTTGKATVIVRRVDDKVVSGSYNSAAGAEVMPDFNRIGDRDIKGRISAGHSLKIDGRYAYFWDGNSQNVYID